jgi:hypothetical protein
MHIFIRQPCWKVSSIQVTFRMTTCLLVCQVEKLLADRKAGHRVGQVSHLLPTGTQVLQALLAPPLKRR